MDNPFVEALVRCAVVVAAVIIISQVAANIDAHGIEPVVDGIWYFLGEEVTP